MVEWRISTGPVDYPTAIAEMEARAQAIHDGTADELVWLLEHPPLYTAGTSAKADDLLAPDRFPVYPSGRGGQYTYHGPGQRVVYLMLDLRQREKDVRAYVCHLEDWIIRTLAQFGVTGERRTGRVGIWVPRGPLKEDKIAAIGVRIRRWVTLHGLAINVNPDLGHFGGIVPCGISQHGVTSLHDLGKRVSMAEVDAALRSTFDAALGPHRSAAPGSGPGSAPGTCAIAG